eukprot:TRINITY_DN10029_c0_g1_i2.p1 TRINITY_DN10029_c0_g1~~TRINITY_DN10029_c0_g1_i2.p1  ORF type:complete len:1072 (+),score=376.20 TRINITY_DN10029_c0_g1_i2:182-3397(+)
MATIVAGDVTVLSNDFDMSEASSSVDISLPFEVEIAAVLLTVGMALLWRSKCQKKHPKHLKSKDSVSRKIPSPNLCQQIVEKGTAGEHAEVLKLWNAAKESEPMGTKTLPFITKALLAAEPQKAVEEIADHFSTHSSLREGTMCYSAVLDAFTAEGHAGIMDELLHIFSSNYGFKVTTVVQENMACAYAHDGDMEKFDALWSKLTTREKKVSAKCHSGALRGLLQSQQPERAAKVAKAMKALGYTVTPYLVTEIYRTFVQTGKAAEAMTQCLPEVPPSAHAATILLEHCGEKENLALAKQLMQSFLSEGTQLSYAAQEAYLKLLIFRLDAQAFPLFEKLCRNCRQSLQESSFVRLLGKCADSKYVRFAERVVEQARATSGMSLAIYSAMMKVYSAVDKPELACNLYEKLQGEGLEADHGLRCSLISYASECGNDELVQALLLEQETQRGRDSPKQGGSPRPGEQTTSVAPSSRAQRWIYSIRACAKHCDVEKACSLLEQALAAGCTDRVLFNCALDVCASSGDVGRARELLARMHAMQHGSTKPDLVTYNTMLKVHAAKGDFRGARRLLGEIEAAGFSPNCLSYNMMINIAATSWSANFQVAWDIVELMLSKGMQPDNFTLSTLFKAAKRSAVVADVEKIFKLMDGLKIDAVSDEVLLMAALEMAMKHGMTARLKAVLSSSLLADVKLSANAYAMALKAFAMLKDFQRCLELWNEMVNIRGIEPSRGCLETITEILASEGQGDLAADIIEKSQAQKSCNNQVYSHLLEGLKKYHRKSGVELLEALKGTKLQKKTVLYNLIIEQYTKEQATDCAQPISKIVSMMKQDSVALDNFTLSLQVKAYCYSGQLRMAVAVFEEARLANNVTDTVAFNTLLDGCTRNNEFALAGKLIDSMEAYHVTPSLFTIGSIVKFWGRRRQLAKCFEAVDELSRKYNLVPNGPVNNCLLSACVLNGEVEKGFEVMARLRSAGQQVDTKAASSMIGLCLRSAPQTPPRLVEAVDIAREVAFAAPGMAWNGRNSAGGSRSALEPEVLEQLGAALKQAGRYEELGAGLFERLKSSSYRPQAAATEGRR